MATDASRALLYADLGLLAESVPDPTASLCDAMLDAAALELFDAGIAVDESQPRDLQLLSMYAAWLYRGRVQQTAKPLMLQRLIRNRQAAQAVEGSP